MTSKYILRKLRCLEELCFCYDENNSKISMLQIDSFNYGLFIYSLQSHRISFLKLCVKESVFNCKEDFVFDSNDCTSEKKAIDVHLVNVFCLPFSLLAVVCNKRNVWAVGKEIIINLTPFIEEALVKAKSYENDDIMDTDDVEEFLPNMLDVTVAAPMCEKYNLHPNDIFVGCDFLDSALIRCHENSKLSLWELEFLFSHNKSLSSDVVLLTFLDFPLSYNKSIPRILNQDQNRFHRPLILFIHHSDPEYSLFKNIFGVNCISPNVVCLIGHPDGKLLWSLCDSSNYFQSSHELQVLFDLQQPIVGIFFIKDIEESKGCDCLLLVGALGQLALISSKQHPSFTQEFIGHTFWVKTIHVNSSIIYCDVFKDCLLHVSTNGTLMFLNLSVIFHLTDESEVPSAASSSEFDSIEQIVITDKDKGLVVLKTKYGNLCLTHLKKSTESEAVTSSLPSLMNECLKQSNTMQELFNKKVLQNRLFSTISTFASLKFLKNTLKEPISFSISEVNEEPRKYILVINLKCLENLKLDPELCYISITAFTFFKNSNSFITKSAPYKSDEPTVCLEFTDTALQPPLVSVFPLFVEIGLILHLPENWKNIDCFTTVSSFLPFYIRIQTFMIHELNLFQNNALCFPQSLKFEIPQTLKMIKELGIRRPVANILQLDPKIHFNPLKKFNLCLSVATAEEMLKNTCEPGSSVGSDICKYIEKLLYGNILENSIFKESYLTSKCSPISISLSTNGSHVVITLTANNSESLIGLKIAVMESLLATYRKSKQITNSSAYVNIPASMYRRCEEISKALMDLYGKDVESQEITCKIINLYKELRTDISGKLPNFVT